MNCICLSSKAMHSGIYNSAREGVGVCWIQEKKLVRGPDRLSMHNIEKGFLWSQNFVEDKLNSETSNNKLSRSKLSPHTCLCVRPFLKLNLN